MRDTFNKLWSLFSAREHLKIIIILVAMLIGGALESIGIGIIMPFVAFIQDPNIISEYPKLDKILGNLGLVETSDVLIALSIGLFIFFVLKNVFLAFSSYFQIRFAAIKRSELASRLLRVYLFSPYTFHLQRNTAELLRNINNEVLALFNNVLLQLIYLFKELLVTVAVIVMLLILRPLSSFIAIVLLGGTSIIYYRLIRVHIKKLGKRRQGYSFNMIKWINQSMGSIKETKILGREEYFLRIFTRNSLGDARAYSFLQAANMFPRLFLETMTIGAILILAIIDIHSDNAGSLIPTLALFAAAAFRLLPSVNSMIGAVNSIRYHKSAVDVVHHDIMQKGDSQVQECGEIDAFHGRSEFKSEIAIKDLTFRYPNTNKDVLEHISLVIKKGDGVGFIGPSGAGKTTCVDVILGLLKPSEGNILVDGRDIYNNLRGWQNIIGYVPQFIYLSDDSLGNNIAFGLDEDEIDEKKIWSAVEKAQLVELVHDLPEGLDTHIGELGVRLSGGQRQRIGIARALYNDPEVLVMDEATSSLDTETELGITKAIDRLSGEKTLIIIAHRMSTVENCDVKYYFRDGKLEDVKESFR